MNGISSKVGLGAAAGAVTIVLVWIVGLLGLVVPPEVSSAVTVLITAVVGYLVPETRSIPIEDAQINRVVTDGGHITQTPTEGTTPSQ